MSRCEDDYSYSQTSEACRYPMLVGFAPRSLNVYAKSLDAATRLSCSDRIGFSYNSDDANGAIQ